MHKVRRTEQVGYEDLMREMAIIEQHLLIEDRDLAMRLMVLEAQIRERFQELEYRVIKNDPTYQLPLAPDQQNLLSDFNSLIPQELPPFPTLMEMETIEKKKKLWETVGMAAFLAVATALGVFGLASVLHLALSFVS